MNLEDTKVYLKKRINSEELLALSDEDLTKYFETAKLILGTFYEIDSLKELQSLALVIGEEMLFLFNSNIDLNLFYQYQGLASFNVGKGSVQGSVDYSRFGELIPRILKAILASLEIEEKMELQNKVKNVYTWI